LIAQSSEIAIQIPEQVMPTKFCWARCIIFLAYADSGFADSRRLGVARPPRHHLFYRPAGLEDRVHFIGGSTYSRGAAAGIGYKPEPGMSAIPDLKPGTQMIADPHHNPHKSFAGKQALQFLATSGLGLLAAADIN
jgi:hypothetical protein